METVYNSKNTLTIGAVSFTEVSAPTIIAPTFSSGTTAPMQFTGTGSVVSVNAGSSGLTETFTVSGNTSFVGNVTVTTDASSNNYVLARRVPAGSLDVTQYVTGSVPLTTTTSLINNYLSNAAQITSNTGTGSITQALRLPGTANSGVIWQSGGHSVAVANLALSNLFIEAWINPVVGSTLPVLSRKLGSNYDVVFYATSAGILTASVYNTSGAIAATASNATALVSGTWYHVSASYQRTSTTAGTLRVFVNGGVGGTTGTVSTQPRVQPSANVNIGFEQTATVITGQNLYVAVSGGGTFTTAAASSTDGITWTPRTLPVSASWSSVTVNPTTGVFVAVAGGPTPGNTTIGASSTDGITWTQRVLPNLEWTSVTVNRTTGVFVAVGQSNGATTVAASSTDGITWTQRTIEPNITWRSVTCNPTTGVFVAVGDTGNGPSSEGASSTNGITWTRRTFPTNSYWRSVTCNPNTGIFAAVAGNSVTSAASSTDGITWTARGLPQAVDWQSVTCNPTTGIFSASSFSSFGAYSPDGISWGNASFPFNANWRSLTVNQTTGVFFCVATAGGQGASSTDGITWTSRSTSAGAASLYAVTSVYQATTIGAASFTGNVADVRVFSGSLGVPTATFASPASAPFTQSAPSYATGMSSVGTANTVLALQSQYFPGASTSPYGPCLTLPGTVGSFYSQSVGTHSDWKGTGGFTLEAWVNYASFASANALVTGASQMYTIVSGQPTSTGNTWTFGATTNGTLAFGWRTSTSTASMNAFVTSTTLTTGSWNHVLVQSNASNVYMAINGRFTTLTAQGFTPTAGNATIAPTIAPSTSNTASSELSYPVTAGQFNSLTGPNVAVAKARLIYGANVYSTGSFTPNPNFATSATAPFWSLDSQYALPTYPSFFDVPQLPQQLDKYGAEPVVVGGVTSNVLSPYSTTYPQLDSIRFDGTGYIDYGNAASSVMTTNLWANAWTIEVWVYPTSVPCQLFERSNLASGFDFSSNVNASGQVNFYYGASTVGPTLATVPVNTWTHVAVTYDGTRSNIYVSSNTVGTANISTTVTGTQAFVPTYSTHFGYNSVAGNYLNGNLADLRVSNVARYTGSTYTVPTAPFTTNANTLLLLKSLAGQVGTTLQVQGRGLNAVSLGATRSVQSYPPAPMSSYLLDTTSNALVTYGQGKYVASASREFGAGTPAWLLFNKASSNYWQAFDGYSTTSPYPFTGSITTVDTLGNSYAGEWVQLQMSVSIILSSYVLQTYGSLYSFTVWAVLGSRDGTNWTLVDRRSGATWVGGPPAAAQTFTASATQAYNYYRLVGLNGSGSTIPALYAWVLNGTEESLCITSDSKVGVGIANPQRALEVAGDLVVGGTISGGAGMGSFRNRIINGDMRIAQRGVTMTLAAPAPPIYSLDRMYNYINGTSGTFVIGQQNLVASDTPYQLGFANSLRVTSASGPASTLGYVGVQYRVEAYSISDFQLGTPFASPFTVSFWFRSACTAGSVVSIGVRNGANFANTYAATFTVNTPSTWQYQTVTIPPPPTNTAGGWNSSSLNLVGMYLDIGTYSPAPNTPAFTWVQTSAGSANGSTPILSIAGNYIEFTGLQLERGTVATPFEFRNFSQELALCQRYFQKSLNIETAPGTATEVGNWSIFTPYAVANGNNLFISGPSLQVSMRGTPTIVFYGSSGAVSTTWNALGGSSASTWRYLNNTSGVTQNQGTTIGLAWTASTEL